MKLDTQTREILNAALARRGLRSTRQRECVFGVVHHAKDHPTADVIFARVRTLMPTISLATVYNTLETLAACDLIRQVNFEREPSRYCYSNNNQPHHAHFHCTATNRVFDLELPEAFISSLASLLPDHFLIEKIDLCLSGTCAASGVRTEENTSILAESSAL